VLHRELAELYERKLSDRAAAVQQLTAALELDPKNLEVLRGLARLHRASESWGPLAAALEGLAQVVPEPSEKMALWREAAALNEQHLSAPERAAHCWRQIAERDPLDREAAGALDRLYSGLDRSQELAFALELRRAQEGQSPQGRELAFRLARLRQQRLSDSAGALQLYRQILAEDPGHPGAREALEEWARLAVPESAAALEILDPVLVQMGDHATRVNLRKAQLPRALTEEKARLAAEVRAIYERDLSRVDLAFTAALEAFAANIDREGLRHDLERLVRATGGYRDLAKAYEDAANSQMPGDASIPMLLRRAAELREQLGQPEEAIRLWKELLSEFPNDRQALDSLGKLYERSRNAKNLSEVYARKAQLSQDPAERLALLLKAGAAYESAGEDAQAIEVFRTSLAISQHPDALSALDRLYGKAGRTDEQADVLDQLASVATDEASRVGLLLRRAALLEKTGGPGEALNAYARVLDLAPGDAEAVAGLERLVENESVRQEAARLLEPIYRSVKDARKLVEILDIRMLASDQDRRPAMLEETARLRESLGQKPLAFAARLRAFAEQPEREDTREELERLAAETASFEELAAAYEDQLERGSSEALALDLWRRLANIYAERMSRLDLAARAYEEVSRRDPQNPRPLEALSSIYWKAREFKPLAVVMRRRIALEKSAAAQVQMLFELGNLAEEMLSDRVLAAQCYQAILQRKPDDPNAIKFLSRVLAESERYPELAQLIGREIQLAEQRGANEESYDLMVRLGRLKQARLNDPRGALEMYQEVLRRRPAHAGAVGALEEMARSDSPLRGDAATALEPVFAAHGDHLKLVQMLEQRVATEVVPQERVALLHKVAELYAGPMDNPSMAFLTATRALKERPDDERSLALCLQLSAPAEASEELAAVLEEVAAKASDDRARAGLFRALARLKEQGGEGAEALVAWRRVLELQPSDVEALDAVARQLQEEGRAPELLEILRRKLTLEEDPDARIALFLRVANLQEEGLRDPIGAMVTLRRLLEIKPDDEGALEQLERLCQKQERWPELADVIARRIALQGPSAPLAFKFRLGQVRELRLLDRQGALALYSEIVAQDPAHPDAIERLEAIAQREPGNVTVLDVLLRAYRRSGDVTKLGQALEGRAGATVDSWEKKALLTELAELREGQGEPEMAFLALFRAFKEDPNDAALRARLEKDAQAAGAFDELVSAYEEQLPRIAEASDAAQVCLKMGELLERHLDEPERAVECYEKARTLDPKSSPQALTALDRIHAELANFEALAAVLEARVGFAADDTEKVGLLFRLGQLLEERLDSPDRAADAYERVRALDPGHLPSARLLERIYEAAGHSQKLFGILEAQRDLVTGPERDRVLTRMAQVSSDGLSDVGHSIELYRELLAKNPRNDQAFAALEGLLERSNRAEELQALLVQKIGQTLDPRELVRLNDRAGRVTLTMMRKPEEAIAFFKAALDRDPRHKGALEALRDIYEQLSRRDELVTVLRRLVPLQEDAVGVKALRIRLAEVLAEMGRREEAVEAARRALEVEPHATSELSRIHKIFLGLRAYTDAGRVLELKAQVHLDADERDHAVATLFEGVDLWRGPGGKPESSGPVLERILELDPANRQAFELASDLYVRLNDWRAYAATLDRYLPNLVTDEEKIASLRDLVRVREQKLGQKDLAFMAACRALQLDPSKDDIREEVERLADETGSYEELAAVYEGVADSLPKGPLAERLYRVLAKVQDLRLDEPEAAEASLRKILEFDPTNAVALDGLATMFARRGRDKEYVVALEQQLEAAESIEQRKTILREIARVYDEKRGDPAEAAAALQRSLELEADADTLNALVALYRRQASWLQVASALLRLRDLASDPLEKARVQNEVALVHEREIGDDEAAIEAWRQSLELDPFNREAVDALERLYTKLDRPAELLHVYQRQLELATDYRERVRIFFKSAAIWEDKLQNPGNADICVESILQIEPSNLQAIKALERLRRQQDRWEELVSVLDRHIQLSTESSERAELMVEVGHIYHQQLKLVDRAAQYYQYALEADPSCRPAMHALGTLYERSGNWPFALEMIAREAELLGGSPEAVELWHRMGKINEDMLMDVSSARSAYERALQIDPSYLPSIRALKGVHEGTKDWVAYEQALIQEAQRTEDPEAKSRALLEVAKFRESKDDRASAASWYEDALRLSPDSLEAALPLADIYVARED
ncbi:MAG TPA: tetratricopeptide repeat protein, partial [Longimicrobium sp.]|nr:tetratricopeptide repeat protein [Longimicrobium sp.]